MWADYAPPDTCSGPQLTDVTRSADDDNSEIPTSQTAAETSEYIVTAYIMDHNRKASRSPAKAGACMRQ